MVEDPAEPIDPLNYLLVLDVGSSSVRCCAYTLEDDTTISKAEVIITRPRMSVHPVTGKIRQVMGLLDTINGCVDAVLDELASFTDSSTGFAIKGVGFSSFVMNLIGIDECGNPVGDDMTLSYACNSEAVVEEVAALSKELGEERSKRLYEKTGAPSTNAAYAIAQLRELYLNFPDRCLKVKKWQTIASWCLSTWINELFLPISYSEASWTGLLNFRTCEYEPDALMLLPDDCAQTLPDLADYDTILLHKGIPTSSPFYDRWPQLQGVRLFLGLGDGACANIGSKCTVPARIACTVGTSAAARVSLRFPMGHTSGIRVEPGLFCYRIDRDHVVLGGALTDGGSTIEWARRLLNIESPEDFENCIAEVEELENEEDSAPRKSKRTLTFAPFLGGERSTGFRSGATGTIIGLTRDTTTAHFLKACLEGVTLRLAAVIGLIQKSVGYDEVPRIIASGNALERNALWRQMISDCTGLQVIFDEDTEEGTSRGVACLLSGSLGSNGSSTTRKSFALEIIHPTKVSKPRPQRKDLWCQLRSAQEDLINKVSPLYR